MADTWTQQARERALKLLAEAPSLKPEQRRKYLADNCPYNAPEQIRGWKALIKNLCSPRPVKFDYSKMSPEEQAWHEKNAL